MEKIKELESALASSEAKIKRMEHNWCVLMKKLAEKEIQLKDCMAAGIVLRLEKEISKMKHDEWQDGMNGNTDVCHIRELQRKLAEKDKELKKERDSREYFQGQMERLKKENGRILENKMLKSD